MTVWQEEARKRVEAYAIDRGLTLTDQLGQGFDGVVFSTDGNSALKSFAFERLYRNERNIYLRLMEKQVDEVLGFDVPRLIWADDQLWVIEIGIVSPPFVLDFAGAYLDQAPDYPDDVMEQWQAEKSEQFGAERWEIVQSIMAKFAALGIYLADVKPGNITFAD